jgi:CRP/FNR family transcriptional regulator, cyclic AMP receptor protein
MIRTNPDPLAVLKSSPVFSMLSETQLRELAGKARVEHYGERTLLNQRGESPDYIRYICSGGVEVVLTTEEGGYSSLPIFEGRWATWLGCFGGEPPIYDLWSAASATIVAFPNRDIQKTLAGNTSALLKVIGELAEYTRFLTGLMLSFSAYRPEKRLVYLLLLASSSACGFAQEGQPTALTQTHISQFGFGSRQKVSRLLRSLADRGLIETKYGGVVIPSRARLEQFITQPTPPRAAPSRQALMTIPGCAGLRFERRASLRSLSGPASRWRSRAKIDEASRPAIGSAGSPGMSPAICSIR